MGSWCSEAAQFRGVYPSPEEARDTSGKCICSLCFQKARMRISIKTARILRLKQEKCIPGCLSCPPPGMSPPGRGYFCHPVYAIDEGHGNTTEWNFSGFGCLCVCVRDFVTSMCECAIILQPFCLSIAFFVDSLKGTVHYCRKCNAQVGKFN